MSYLNKYNIKIANNVETTIRQWYDKYASYFYSTGTIFFCKTPEKGKLIKTLIRKGMVKAYEIKRNEIFLIPEESKDDFFGFLDKSEINYFEKRPKSIPEKKQKKKINLSRIFVNP